MEAARYDLLGRAADERRGVDHDVRPCVLNGLDHGRQLGNVAPHDLHIGGDDPPDVALIRHEIEQRHLVAPLCELLGGVAADHPGAGNQYSHGERYYASARIISCTRRRPWTTPASAVALYSTASGASVATMISCASSTSASWRSRCSCAACMALGSI